MKRLSLPFLVVLMLLLAACGLPADPEASSGGETEEATTGGTTGGTTASSGSADVLAVTPDLRNRPRTGIFVKRQGGGTSFVEVTNNSGLDAAVYLMTSEDELAQAGYVRNEEMIRLTGFRDGEYSMYVIAGNGWDMGQMNFTQEPVYYRYSEPVVVAADGGPATVAITLEADTAAAGEALTFEDYPGLR